MRGEATGHPVSENYLALGDFLNRDHQYGSALAAFTAGFRSMTSVNGSRQADLASLPVGMGVALFHLGRYPTARRELSLGWDLAPAERDAQVRARNRKVAMALLDQIRN